MTINNLEFRSLVIEPGRSDEAKTNIYRIAIIGGGPKGLYGLERLLACLHQKAPSVPVELHWFNRSPHFGAGDVYRPDQPEFLIMNFSNGRINIWSEGEPQAIVAEPLSFVDWLQKQGETADPRAYASRAKVGAYLMDGFAQLQKQCPEGTSIHTHTGEVTDLIPDGEQYFLELETPAGKSRLRFAFRQILLTTGHPRAHAGFPELTADTKIKEQRLENQLVRTIYPVREQLSPIRARENVLIKGLGLTFIDAVLALTEGRGGYFTGSLEDGLHYQPSGLEPHKILPYSRTGLPMFPRLGEVQTDPLALNYFKPTRLDEILQDKKELDFRNDLLPLIKQEIRVSYYRVLFRNYGLELEICEDFDGVEAQIELFHAERPEEARFCLENLLTPLPQPAMGLHQSFIACLDEYLQAAKTGPDKSPLAAAAATWRVISPVFNEYYAFGGLRPQGQREFQEQYAGHFNRLSYGPPVENLEKIRAIAAAGLLDFSFARSPRIEFRGEMDCFLITHPHHQLQTAAFYWIDARIPKVDIRKDPSPLYRNLLNRGLIRTFRNTDGANSYCPGCMDLDFDGHPRDARGRSVERITVYGTPTEGITYDNDTLSRTRNNFVDGWAGAVVQEIASKVKR